MVFIPNKLYFRIGEVSDLVEVKPYVLRYWESEFGDIRPMKSKSGQRLYKHRDVEMLILIKDLLHEKRFTIDGARKFLRERTKEEVVFVKPEVIAGEQLEVFTEPPKKEEVLPRVVEQKVVPLGSGEHKKVFKKIKNDLEALLQFVRE